MLRKIKARLKCLQDRVKFLEENQDVPGSIELAFILGGFYWISNQSLSEEEILFKINLLYEQVFNFNPDELRAWEKKDFLCTICAYVSS
jgi:hypothetical protein